MNPFHDIRRFAVRHGDAGRGNECLFGRQALGFLLDDAVNHRPIIAIGGNDSGENPSLDLQTVHGEFLGVDGELSLPLGKGNELFTESLQLSAAHLLSQGRVNDFLFAFRAVQGECRLIDIDHLDGIGRLDGHLGSMFEKAPPILHTVTRDLINHHLDR